MRTQKKKEKKALILLNFELCPKGKALVFHYTLQIECPSALLA
jgi:hypothetical protein